MLLLDTMVSQIKPKVTKVLYYYYYQFDYLCARQTVKKKTKKKIKLPIFVQKIEAFCICCQKLKDKNGLIWEDYIWILICRKYIDQFFEETELKIGRTRSVSSCGRYSPFFTSQIHGGYFSLGRYLYLSSLLFYTCAIFLLFSYNIL